MFTEINKSRQRIALALSLEGKALEIAIDIDKFLLMDEDSVRTMLTELDKSFE